MLRNTFISVLFIGANPYLHGAGITDANALSHFSSECTGAVAESCNSSRATEYLNKCGAGWAAHGYGGRCVGNFCNGWLVGATQEIKDSANIDFFPLQDAICRWHKMCDGAGGFRPGQESTLDLNKGICAFSSSWVNANPYLSCIISQKNLDNWCANVTTNNNSATGSSTTVQLDDGQVSSSGSATSTDSEIEAVQDSDGYCDTEVGDAVVTSSSSATAVEEDPDNLIDGDVSAGGGSNIENCEGQSGSAQTNSNSESGSASFGDSWESFFDSDW